MEVIWKGYLLCQKGKGLDLGAEPPLIKLYLVKREPSLLHLTNDNDDKNDNEEEEEEKEEDYDNDYDGKNKNITNYNYFSFSIHIITYD